MDNYLQERWIKDRDFFVSKANASGAEVIVESAIGDADKQFEQAKKVIEQGVDVIVIVPVEVVVPQPPVKVTV